MELGKWAQDLIWLFVDIVEILSHALNVLGDKHTRNKVSNMKNYFVIAHTGKDLGLDRIDRTTTIEGIEQIKHDIKAQLTFLGNFDENNSYVRKLKDRYEYAQCKEHQIKEERNGKLKKENEIIQTIIKAKHIEISAYKKQGESNHHDGLMCRNTGLFRRKKVSELTNDIALLTRLIKDNEKKASAYTAHDNETKTRAQIIQENLRENTPKFQLR